MVDAVMKPPNPRRRMVLQLILTLVIFLSGIVIGTGGTMEWLRKRGPFRPPRSPGPDPNQLVTWWAERFDLSAEQGEQIKAVLVQVDQKRRDAYRELQTQMEAGFNEMIEGIKAAMTPEQFERWHEEFQKRMREHRRPKEGWRRGGQRGERDPNRSGPRGERDPNRPERDGGRRGGPRGEWDPKRMPPPDPPPSEHEGSPDQE